MTQCVHNILWLIDGLGMGGAERLMEPYLRYLDKTKFNPRVCVLQERDGNPMAERIQQLGIPVDLLPISRLRQVNNIPRLREYMRQHHIHLVHTQLEFSNTLGTIAARMQQIPALCTLHTFEEQNQTAKTTWHVRLMWQVLRGFSQQIIAVSEEVRQYHIRFARFAPDRIITLYNGIDLSRFQSSAGDIRSELGISEDTLVLLTIAVLREAKGIQYMIDAMPFIETAVPDVTYVVVGDGAYGPSLRQLAQEKNDPHILFTGARQDIPELLAASDLFVLPTLLDALPTVLIEAMAAGKPIIATRVGGVPEIVEQGHNGLLVSPMQSKELAEACVQLLQDKPSRIEMGQLGQELARQRFDIHTQAKKLGNIYEAILA